MASLAPPGRSPAEEHPIVPTSGFENAEGLALYLIHLRAYEEAGRMAAGKRVLDWGCNDGYGLEVMRRYGCTSLYGMDISPTAIKAARARLGAAARVFLCDGLDVPVRSGAFDLVTSFQVIEHVSDCERYLAGITRALKPGGLAIFTTPNAAIRLSPGMTPWNEFHIREYLASELAARLKPHFSRVEIKGLFGADGLHRTELERCHRARSTAHTPPPEGSALWRRALRAALPDPMLASIRARRLRPRAALRAPELPSWSTGDLFYRSGDLSSALDLMATCTK